MLAIVKNVEPEQLPIILPHQSDPVAAWEALKSEHVGSSSQDIATIMIELSRKLLSTGANENEAKKHFSEMTMLATRLKAADATRALSDADLATKLLLSLPDEFEQIR